MKKKPRILMIAPLPPPVHGSAMMTKYIKDSTVINGVFDLDWVNLSTSRRMDEIGKTSISKLFRFAGAFIKTLWNLLTRRYDACYIALTCHGEGFLKDAPFALMCKLFGNKLIIHQHNKGMSEDVDRPFYKQLFSSVYKNSSVILLSWRLFPDIKKIVNRNQIFICPNGIPRSKVFPKNETDHLPQILFLSNLIESKGVLVLLDACKILNEEGQKFICKFVGGESKEIDAERFIKEVRDRELNNIVEYLGKKFDEEKNCIIASSDILVLPTSNECFPLVILEAMQQGTTVISTDVGGIPDIIESGVNGIVIPPMNSEILALKIKELLKSPEKIKKIGENGQRAFSNRYTLEKWENTLLDIIKDVVER